MNRAAAAAVLACLALSPGLGAAAAQPPAPAAVPPAAPTPASVLARVQARYRAGPTCEQIQVELRADSGRASRSWLVARLNPRPQPTIALELGPLRIAADGRTLAAVHNRNPGTFFAAPIPGDGPLTLARLGEVLPPVPVFALDLLGADDPSHLSALTAYARDVRWLSATPDPRGPGRITLEGRSDRGRVLIVVRGDQVQSLELRDDPRAVTLKLLVRPAVPCRDEDLRIDTAGRTEVKRLTDLQPRGGVLRPGAAVPEMQLSSAAGQVQKLKDLFTPPPEFLPAPAADRLVLVFTRRGRENPLQPQRLARVDLAPLAAALRSMQRDIYSPGARRAPGEPRPATDPEAAALLPPFNYAQVMVLEAPPEADALLELIKRERRAWGNRPVSPAGIAEPVADAGEHLAWTTDAHSSVDLFAAAGESVAIVLDADQRLRSVIPIGERTTTEELVDQLTAALMESGD